jgi:cytoplasmic iron level regulating protein YaaA (DUF328/UPF0246 family)
VLILLPPSEGKYAPVRGKPLALEGLSFPVLTSARTEVLDVLGALCAADPAAAAATLGLGPTQLDEVARNTRLLTSPTARADAIYTGVVYDHLDVDTLSAAARRRATRWLAVQSSLFGLVRPGDRIPAYRLSGDTHLPGLGVVSAHWRGVLTPVVQEAAGDGLVVDLRSGTYASFWRPEPHASRRVATVRVLQQVGDQRKVVSHFNKATKGRLVRAMLEDGSTPRTPAALADLVTALGWKAELGEPGRHGTPIDVVVEDL